LLSAITSRIRQWLGSRRKYEISPRESCLKASPSDVSANKVSVVLDWDKVSDRQIAVRDTAVLSVGGGGGSNRGSGFFESSIPCNASEVDAALNRCGAGHLSPSLPPRLPNGYAAATAAESGKIPLQRSPVSCHNQNRVRSPTTPNKTTSVLSMLTAALANSPVGSVSKAYKDSKDAAKASKDAKDAKSGKKDNAKHSRDNLAGEAGKVSRDASKDGLAASAGGGSEKGGAADRGGLTLQTQGGGNTEGRAGKWRSRSPVDIRIEVVDVSGQKPSALSPSASRLLASSRRHLLRQSRSKLKDRVTSSFVTSLIPSASPTNLMHQPLTTTISCPPQAEAVASIVLTDPLAIRRCHSWPLPRRKAFPGEFNFS
jgi:hypothetical protein